MAIAIEVVVKGIIVIALLMLSAAYMTFMERVVMASMQLRLGPNRVGPLGLLQPIADGIKLLMQRAVSASWRRPLHLLAGSRHLPFHSPFCICPDPVWGNCDDLGT